MINFLNFFSIKQKLAILLIFLLGAVTYIAISSINNAKLHAKNNIKIEIAQQQHLVVEQFINALFFTKQQTFITGEKANNRALKNNQDLFEKNLKAMLEGGEFQLDLPVKNTIQLEATSSNLIIQEIQDSQKLWDDLQRASQNISLRTININQLDIFQHIGNKLREKLTNIVTLFTLQREQSNQQDQLTLQLTLLFILLMGVGFAWLVAQNITQPLDTISKATSRIRLGDLKSYPIKNNNQDELGTLFYQADEMRIALSELILSIQQHNKQITHSSSQLQQLSNEVNTLHHLQYTHYESIATQLHALQQHNQHQLNLLTQRSNYDLKNQQIIGPFLQQQDLQINSINETLNKSLQLLNECNNKANANQLFVQDLNKISQQLAQLSHKYKTDVKENITRKGNDKRLYPRINNQVKVTLNQDTTSLQGVTQYLSLSGLQLKSKQSVQFDQNIPITFTIKQPTTKVINDVEDIILQGELVHYEQKKDGFYYNVQFHPLDEQEKIKLQQMFNYFEKKSEFKSEQ